MNMWKNSLVKLRKLVKYRVINASLNKRKLAKVEMADNQQDNVDYSSLSVDEIKKQMDERYAKNNAYNLTVLWDIVRMEEINRLVIKRIAPTQGKTILEIGCSIGGSAAYIADCEKFIGTDLSDAAISQANSLYGEKENFSFMSMDATRLEFEDNKFDVVIAKEVIEHLLEPQKAL